MSGVEIKSRGLLEMIAAVTRMPGDTDEAAYLAVFKGARDGRVMGQRQAEEEINFPKGYLKPAGGRLSITKRASLRDPEAIISGRDRPTLLARFSTTKARFGRQYGVSVRVSPGHVQRLDSGFFLRLKNNNIGLAVRVPKGGSLRNSRAAKDLGGGVYLLYGPSVDQVFQGVAADIVDDVSDILEREFTRQFRRLNNGR